MKEVTLYGSVIDASTGAPLYNAQVYLGTSSPDKEDFNVFETAATGTDGNYEINIYYVDINGHYAAAAAKFGYRIEIMKVSLAHVQDGGRAKLDFHLAEEK